MEGLSKPYTYGAKELTSLCNQSFYNFAGITKAVASLRYKKIASALFGHIFSPSNNCEVSKDEFQA